MAAYKEAALGDVTIAGSLLLGGGMAARGVVTLPLKPMRAVLGVVDKRLTYRTANGWAEAAA